MGAGLSTAHTRRWDVSRVRGEVAGLSLTPFGSGPASYLSNFYLGAVGVIKQPGARVAGVGEVAGRIQRSVDLCEELAEEVIDC